MSRALRFDEEAIDGVGDGVCRVTMKIKGRHRLLLVVGLAGLFRHDAIITICATLESTVLILTCRKESGMSYFVVILSIAFLIARPALAEPPTASSAPTEQVPAAQVPSVRLSAAQQAGRDVARRLKEQGAVSGRLTPAQVDTELKIAHDSKRPSAERLASAAAVMNACAEFHYQPTLKQLESLLKSDVPELRILAVDWFRLAQPADAKLRASFLKQARETKPRQVRERASEISEAP